MSAVPQLRAAFIALHLFAITALAMPSVGGGMRREAWKEAVVQAEFAAWTKRLNGLGLTLSQAELEEQLWALATGYEGARSVVLTPFMPYYRYCGTYQSWRMFIAPQRYPARMEIHIDQGAGWEPVYVMGSERFDWLAYYLRHDRFRAAVFRYGWKHYRGARGQFSTWVAKQAARDFPEASQVRVSFVRYRTPSPAEVMAHERPKEARELTTVRRLAPLRRP